MLEIKRRSLAGRSMCGGCRVMGDCYVCCRVRYGGLHGEENPDAQEPIHGDPEDR